jgi:type IV pilus assembly protein PilY1
VALALAAHGNTALAQTVTFPPTPLTVASGTPPNLLYVHDDSTSMHYAFVPETTEFTGIRSTTPANGDTGKKLTSHVFNKIYYNPAINYLPPPDRSGTGNLGNANFGSAWWNGYASNRGSGGIDLSNYKITIRSTPSTAISWEIPSYSAGNATVYYHICPNGAATCAPGNLQPKTLTTAAEKQNFANWYSYYRTRNLAAKAGIAFGFEHLDSSIRLGWGKISLASALAPAPSIDGKSVGTLVEGVRTFTPARKTAFIEWMYDLDLLAMGTPLRRALGDAGRYYTRGSGENPGPWADDPATGNGSENGACRKSFTLLMTDGYWTEGSAGNPTTAADVSGNPDGGKGKPFEDSFSNTLADVAWYYWAKDLAPSIPNNVPKTSAPGTEHLSTPQWRDDATWQHMTTFTIALGLDSGTVDPTDAFNKLTAKLGGASVSGPNWPQVMGTNNIVANGTDDLLHAAINGHGGFFMANNYHEFAQAITEVANSINAALKSSGGLDTNVDVAAVGTGAYVYGTTYMPRTWNGDLFAQGIDVDSGLQGIVWHAAEQLPPPNSRKIFTRNGNGVSFQWSSLSSSQQTALKGPGALLDGEKVLNYIRGASANEGANSGQFRSRVREGNSASPLGDSPHNAPVYVESGGNETLYLGANDGMLHAFNAANGVEQFAYVPATLIPKLYKLTNNHDYFVDGYVAVSDDELTPNQRLLVGALGRGGKGLYGLDVTNPASFSANNVLWELDGGNCSDNTLSYLGNAVGEIALVNIASAAAPVTTAVFGNGYNSCADRAALFKVNAASGAATRIEASSATGNGLAAPVVWKKDEGHIFAYAGDLKGQLHKFDLLANTASPLFNAGAGKPLTGQPTVFKAPAPAGQDRPYVLFGAGRYLSAEDKTVNIATQSAYGLIDPEDSSGIASSDLKARVFTNTNATVGNNPVVVIEKALSTDMQNKKGWYFDLHPGIGERIVEQPLILHGPAGDIVVFASIVPPEGGDLCEGSGSSWLYFVDARTGGRLDFPFLDINGDGAVDDNDKAGDDYVSGVKLKGMIKNLKVVFDGATGRSGWIVSQPQDPASGEGTSTPGGTGGTGAPPEGKRFEIPPLGSCPPEECPPEKSSSNGAGRISWREIIGQ